MRQSKFRAWDKQEKQMVYGIEETYDGLPYSELNEKVELDIYNHMSCFSSWVCGDYEVMQYTGNNDKKDVEIYENDIVEDEYNRKYLVVFKGDCWRCEPISKGLKNRWISNHLMVIGNVYSSPELLEDGAE